MVEEKKKSLELFFGKTVRYLIKDGEFNEVQGEFNEVQGEYFHIQRTVNNGGNTSQYVCPQVICMFPRLSFDFSNWFIDYTF